MKIQPHQSASLGATKSGVPKRRLSKTMANEVRRHALKGLLSLLVAGCTLSSVGCTSISQGVFAPYGQSGCGLCTDLRARATARAMWNSQYSHCYCNSSNSKHIRKGFVDGFVATAAGGNGCTPLVPPTSCCGFGKRLDAKAWFQGYPLGVAAAQSSGANNWSKIAISPDLAACMANTECTPGCVPCSQNAGVLHSGMVHDQFNAPPVPIDIDEAPMIDDPNTINDTMAPLPPEDTSQESEDAHLRNEVSDLDAERMNDDEAADALNSAEPLEVLNAEPEVDSPSDRGAPAPLDRSDDDLTGAEPPKPQQAERFAATKEIPVARPTQEAPIVGQPIVLPTMESESPPSQVSTAGETEPFDAAAPVVGEPVELPNIQVSFDMEGVDWLFGEVDIAQAVLEQSITSSLTE